MASDDKNYENAHYRRIEIKEGDALPEGAIINWDRTLIEIPSDLQKCLVVKGNEVHSMRPQAHLGRRKRKQRHNKHLKYAH